MHFLKNRSAFSPFSSKPSKCFCVFSFPFSCSYPTTFNKATIPVYMAIFALIKHYILPAITTEHCHVRHLQVLSAIQPQSHSNYIMLPYICVIPQ